jgi:hypothetical protein
MTGRRPWYAARGFIASAALLLAVLVVAAAAELIASLDAARPVRPVVAASRPDDVSWGSRCGLPHGAQDPVVGPPRARWVLVGHIPAPTVPGAGPGELVAGDRRCFAHSPLGALVAAANFLPVTAGVTSRRLAMDHYAPGRLRDLYAGQPAIPVAPNMQVATVGFQAAVLDRDAVNVNLAIRVDGVLGYVQLPMRWTTPQGDWRVQLLSERAPLDVGRLDSLDGYIPWSA